MVNQEMQPIELLAPAGGLDAGYAAIHYGADAVYLGLPRFSARAEAANFSLDDLAAITGYAHSREVRRRVYVTVNTLVQDDELDDLVEDLAAVAALGVDAVIVQDLGVYRIIRQHFPELRLHASTQMAIHNRPGVELARELGFARVTLARELTLEELADIAALPGIETEVFVHGALCYSYSGLCLFSSHLMGRSGNRGRCAYLCRDQYRRGDERKFVFSMKDLALPEFVPRLRRAGVTALKIEGRMKNPLYVAAAVKYYRSLIDGPLTEEKAKALTADIQTIFSRPWTNLFLASRWNRNVIEPDYVGHRGYAVGRVEEIVRLSSGEVRLRFHPSQPLEVHDGIQLDVPGLPRPYGFAVERLRVLDGPADAKAMAGRSAGPQSGLVFEAPAGALVEIALPGDHPEIPAGAVVYCASSQEIKRRYRFEKPKPGLFRIRCPVNFEVHITPDRIRATASLEATHPRPLQGGEFSFRFPEGSFTSGSRKERFPFPSQEGQTLVPLQGGVRGGSSPTFPSDNSFNSLDPAPMREARSGQFCSVESVVVTVDIPGAFQAARDADQMRVAVEQAFNKLGATRFTAAQVSVDNPQSCFVPVSLLNQVRRQVTDLLETRYQEALSARVTGIKTALAVAPGISLPAAGAPQAAVCWGLKTDRPALLDTFEDEDWQNVDEVVLEVPPDAPVSFEAIVRRLAGRIGRATIRLALPVIVRRWEQHALQTMISHLIGAGWRCWQAGNLGAWSLLRAAGAEGQGGGLDISADWPMYVLNHVAAEQVLAMGVTRLTLSPEDDGDNMRRLLAVLGEKAAVIVYQDTPLMISEVCVLPAGPVRHSLGVGGPAHHSLGVGGPVHHSLGVGGCDRRGTCQPGELLFSSFKEQVQVINRRCRMVVIQEKPFSLAPHLQALISAGARSLRADFLYREYTSDHVRNIWRRLRAGQALPGTHAGNFERGLR